MSNEQQVAKPKGILKHIGAKIKHMHEYEKKNELMRMVQWLMWAVGFYAVAMVMAHTSPDFYPQIQTVCWKLGNLTIASYLGYRLDISIFRKRITEDSHPIEQIRRAVIIVGAMIAISLGM
jgi:hypothetical protein